MSRRLQPLLRVVAFGILALVACAPETPPSILVVTLDTTRQDHLSVYGYARRTTPGLERLAQESVVYTRAWSTSSWTLPAHASLFTGLFPAAHGAHFDIKAEAIGPLRAGRLDGRFTTLAELLALRGYHTAAIVAGPWLTRYFGLLQGFQYIDDAVPGLLGRSGDKVTESALAWLSQVQGQSPVFLFLNYFDPHTPYNPPEGFDDYPKARESLTPSEYWKSAITGLKSFSPDQVEILIDRYDGEIRFADRELERVLRAFAARTDSDRALIVITADHGESFGEQGRWLHNAWLSEEQLRVPLLIRYPERRGAGTRNDAIVQLPDLFSLVAHEAGIQPPNTVDGVLPGERKYAFAELYRNSANLRAYGKLFNRDLRAVIDWPYKLVVSDRDPSKLFRIDGIRENAVDGAGNVAEKLEAVARAYDQRNTRAPVQPATPDSQTLESLRALGYLE